VRFFLELMLVASLTVTCFVVVNLLSANRAASAVAALIFFVMLLISPLSRHLYRDLFRRWRSNSEGWENYFRD
jgi:membrane protein YdbS with pleckstrin-like domain